MPVPERVAHAADAADAALDGGVPREETGPPAAHGDARVVGELDLERITFFTDAVVAIAMTLLVIDLRLPEWITQTATDEDLRRALDELGRPFLAFALSFVVIATWWFGHHRLVRTLRVVDSRFIFLNIAFLGAIAFLPFPTTMIGRFVDLPTAVVVYAVTNVVAGGALFLMRWRAGRRDLFIAGYPDGEKRKRLAFAAIGPIGFAISIPIAFVAPVAAAVSWNSLWIAAIAVRIWYRGRERATARSPGPG
jgi:uncharacterized membrane protein